LQGFPLAIKLSVSKKIKGVSFEERRSGWGRFFCVGIVVYLQAEINATKSKTLKYALAGTTGYYSAKIAHFILCSKYFEAFLK